LDALVHSGFDAGQDALRRNVIIRTQVIPNFLKVLAGKRRKDERRH
jgi:hypothetical protein